MAENVDNGLAKKFGKVELTLRNVLIPGERLSQTPSVIDGLDVEVETDLRILGCELIQTAGILLKLPQVAMATGQVLFQRFYFSKSFVKHNMEVLAMACINLASKIEEAPRRIRDVINVFHHIKQVKSGKKIEPLMLDQNYVSLKNQVIKAERRVLNVLGFCVHVKHPHKIIVVYLQVIDSHRDPKLVQCAWNYMNDSFRTDVFVRFDPETIACACIFLAARQLQMPLPNSPPWFSLFNVRESDVEEISLAILRLYTRPKVNMERLEKKVNNARLVLAETKRKAKAVTSNSEAATPTNSISSKPGTPNKSSRTSSPYSKKAKLDEDLSDGSAAAGRKRKNMQYAHSPRSRSASPGSRSSRSESRSPRSPTSRKRYRTPPKKYNKNSSHGDHHPTDHHRKRRHHRSHSVESRSPEPEAPRLYKRKSSKHNLYMSPPGSRDHSRDKHKTAKHYRNSSRSKSKKHNGHRQSTSRERYRH